MALASAGYSGASLPAKLGLKDGIDVAFIALPRELDDLAACRSFASSKRLESWDALAGQSLAFDVIHGFTHRRAELEDALPDAQDAIRRDGMIWVSWPKKASKVPTDVTEDTVRNAALQLDLVDVKVAAIDHVWSGLKLVIRKDRR